MWKWWQLGAVACLCGLMAACGGGGGGGTDDGSPIPARAGEAEIGTAGGTVDAVLEGGTTLRIDIPADALTASATLRIEPVPAQAGDLGGFRITPADLALRTPARLTLTWAEGSTPPASLVLAVQRNGQMLPISPAMRGAQLSFELSNLGLVPAELREVPASASLTGAARARAQAASRARAQAPGATAPSETLHLVELTPEQRLEALRVLVAQARGGNGSTEFAMEVQRVFEAVVGDPAIDPATPLLRLIATDWSDFHCGQHRFAVSALETYNGSAGVVFEQRARGVVRWGLVASDFATAAARLQPAMDSACVPRGTDYRQPVLDKLPEFIARMDAATQDIGFDPLIDDELPPMINVEVMLRLVDLDNLMMGLLHLMTDRLRDKAFAACREGQGQDHHQKLLARLVADAGFVTIAGYDAAAVEDDIHRCGMRMDVMTLDDQGAVTQTIHGIGGTANPAEVNMRDVLTVRLEAQGQRLRALQCPGTGARNNEQLVFEAGPGAQAMTELARLTPSAAPGYLEDPQNQEFDAFRLFELRDTTTGETLLRVRREGGLCNGAFPNMSSHPLLVQLRLAFDRVTITTTSLPEGTWNVPYRATVQADGGAEPLTWRATGLPPGLAIDAASGTISGTPGRPSTYVAEISVTDASGQRATRDLRIEVGESVDGTWVGTVTTTYGLTQSANDTRPGSGSPSDDNYTGPTVYRSNTDVSASGTWQVAVDVVAGQLAAMRVISSGSTYVASGSESRSSEFKHPQYGPNICRDTSDSSYSAAGTAVAAQSGGSLLVRADGGVQLSFTGRYEGTSTGTSTITTTRIPGRQACAANSSTETGTSSDPSSRLVPFTDGLVALSGGLSAGVISGSASFTRPVTGSGGAGTETRAISVQLSRQ